MNWKKIFKPVWACAAHVIIPPGVVVYLAFRLLSQSFGYDSNYGKESNLYGWLITFIVPLIVDILFYLFSCKQLKKTVVHSAAFVQRRNLTYWGGILAAIMTFIVPLAVALFGLNPPPPIGNAFVVVLGAGILLNALTSAVSIWLLTPLAR